MDTADVNKKVMESLARCGALDMEGMHRAQIFNGIDFALARSATARRDQQSGQGNLFDLLGDETSPMDDTADFPDCPPWHENEMLAAERELLGIYMSGHPLSQHEEILRRYELCSISKLGELEDRALTRVGGLAASVAIKTTKKKESMAILRLEDLDGGVEVVVWPDTYRKYQSVIAQDATLLIGGRVSRKEETPNLLATEIHPLEDAPKLFSKSVSIHITSAQLESKLQKVKAIVSMNPGGIPLSICLLLPDGEKVIINAENGLFVTPLPEMIHALENELGENTVFVHADPQPLKNPEPQKRFQRARSAPAEA